MTFRDRRTDSDAAGHAARLADIVRAQRIEGCDVTGLVRELSTVLRTGALAPDLVTGLVQDALDRDSAQPAPRRPVLDRLFRSRPYIDRERFVLRNLPGLTSARVLGELTGALSALRTAEWLDTPLPPVTGSDTLQILHRRLFGDVFGWAGDLRTVNLSRRDVAFCSLPQMEDHFNLALLALDRCLAATSDGTPPPPESVAAFLAEYIWAHPFRDGNGRSAMAVVMHLTAPGTLASISPEAWYRASAASVSGAVGALGDGDGPDPRPWADLLAGAYPDGAGSA